MRGTAMHYGRIAVIFAATLVMAACGGAGAPAATSAAPAAAVASAATTAAAAPGAAATAAAASTARGTASGTLNVVLTGGLTGTMTEVKSVSLCSDPANTAGGFAVSIASSLSGAAFSFAVGLGRAYKGPGSYALSPDVGNVVIQGATIRDRWESGTGGTVTVAADGSGTVDTDLKNGANPAPAHVKGSYSCKR